MLRWNYNCLCARLLLGMTIVVQQTWLGHWVTGSMGHLDQQSTVKVDPNMIPSIIIMMMILGNRVWATFLHNFSRLAQQGLKNVPGGTDMLGKWKPVPGKIRIRASIFTSIFMLFYINIPFKLIVSDTLRIAIKHECIFWQLPSTSTIAIVIITRPKIWSRRVTVDWRAVNSHDV